MAAITGSAGARDLSVASGWRRRRCAWRARSGRVRGAGPPFPGWWLPGRRGWRSPRRCGPGGGQAELGGNVRRCPGRFALVADAAELQLAVRDTAQVDAVDLVQRRERGVPVSPHLRRGQPEAEPIASVWES